MSENPFPEHVQLEQVSDAVALQKAVISGPSTAPVSADMVAQIVALYASKHQLAADGTQSYGDVGHGLTGTLANHFEEDLRTQPKADVSLEPSSLTSSSHSIDHSVEHSSLLDANGFEEHTAHDRAIEHWATSIADPDTEVSSRYEVSALLAPSAASANAYEPTSATADYDLNGHYERILREHAHLQGRAEALAEEAAEATRDRAQLQAEVAALRSRLHLLEEHTPQGRNSEQPHESGLAEVGEDGSRPERVRALQLEALSAQLQQEAEGSRLEIRRLRDELSKALETGEQLREMVSVSAEESAVNARLAAASQSALSSARAEVARLGDAVQHLEETARRAEEEAATVVSARDWYQQQLRATQDARSALHDELARLRSQLTGQTEELEHLRVENARTKHELALTQQRALAEKQRLARDLEFIEADMAEREAVANSNTVSAIPTQKAEAAAPQQQQLLPSHTSEALVELQDELQRWEHAARSARAEADSVDAQRVELARRMEYTQQKLVQQERDMDALQEKLADAESRLKSALKKQVRHDALLLKTRQEKNNVEVALQLAQDEKEAFSLALNALKANTAKVEANFKQMRYELNSKQLAYEALLIEKEALQKAVVSVHLNGNKEHVLGAPPHTCAVAAQGGVHDRNGFSSGTFAECAADAQQGVYDVPAVSLTRGSQSTHTDEYQDFGRSPLLPASNVVDSLSVSCQTSATGGERIQLDKATEIDSCAVYQLPELPVAVDHSAEMARLQASLEAAMQAGEQTVHDRTVLAQRSSSLEVLAAELGQSVKELTAAKEASDRKIAQLVLTKAELEAQLCEASSALAAAMARHEQGAINGHGNDLGAPWKDRCNDPDKVCGKQDNSCDSGLPQAPDQKNLLHATDGSALTSRAHQDQQEPPRARSELPLKDTAQLAPHHFSTDIGASDKATVTAAKPAGNNLLETMGLVASNLHTKMAVLQQQMDAHSSAVRTSSESWRTVENEIRDLQRIVHANSTLKLAARESVANSAC